MGKFQKQKEILSRLYQQRILSQGLISTYLFLSEGYTERYCRIILKSLLDEKLIKKRTDVKPYCCYEITAKGVNFLKEYGVFPLGNNLPDTFLPPHKIKIDSQVAHHQLLLNAFVLRFNNEFNELDFEYYDEKFCSFFPHVRPDGLIQIGNTLYFLEMDTGTESKKRLITKWNNYREMLSSTFYSGMVENIRVLFILDKDTRSRAKSLKKWIDTFLLDKITSRFDIVIGNADYLMDYLNDSIKEIDFFPREIKHFARVDNFHSKYTEDFVFGSYLTMLEKDGIKVENETYLEFLYDDCTYNSMYIFRKVKDFNRLNISIKSTLGRYLKYVILVPDEQTAFELLLLTDGYSPQIFFTTPDRLQNGIYSGFFQIYRDGTMIHFAENNFQVPIVEKRFSNLMIKKAQ